MANAGLEGDLTLVLGGTGKTGRRLADAPAGGASAANWFS